MYDIVQDNIHDIVIQILISNVDVPFDIEE